MAGDTSPPDGFAPSRQMAENLFGWLEGEEACALDHAALEVALDEKGRQLVCRMFQDQLDLRALREARLDVVAADGTTFGTVEASHARPLVTIFGEVGVERLAYRHRGHANLYPADGGLNLPAGAHSHGLRRLTAIESTRGSFEGAAEAIERGTGQRVGKRQIEGLARRAAVDVEDFYRRRERAPTDDGDVLVLSCDAKGVVMRPDDLRKQTAAAAAKTDHKMESRLSKGEKRNRKRMAEVATVYEVAPVPRSAEDIFGSRYRSEPAPTPKAKNKWLTASVADDAAKVMADMFDEAERRDPDHQRSWVALVDGNKHQIDRIQAEAAARTVKVTIVVDLCRAGNYADAGVPPFQKAL